MDQRAKLKRQHIMLHRKRIVVRRRFSVEYLENNRLKYTCRTCGKSSIKDYSHEATGKNFSEVFTKRLAAYQDQGGGASGICDHCTKLERDKQYPLPKS